MTREQAREWKYTTEYKEKEIVTYRGKLREAPSKMKCLATHKITNEVIASTWWWIDDGSAEAELSKFLAAYYEAHPLDSKAVQVTP